MYVLKLDYNPHCVVDFQRNAFIGSELCELFRDLNLKNKYHPCCEIWSS